MTRATFTLIAVGVLLSAAGCTATAAGPAPAARSSAVPVPSSARSRSPASPAAVARTAALAAYTGMWQDFVGVGATSDWQSPALGRHATGIALSTLSRGMYADHYSGVITKGKPVLHPTVVSMTPPDDPSTATVNDCGDSTHFLKYHADTGAPADDGPGGRQFIKATVEKQVDGSWKVSDFGIQAVGSC